MDPNEIPIPPEFVPPPEGPVRPPVVTTGSASTAQPQQPSMLDRLRQQVMQDIMPNDAADMQRRARTFGAAMMGTPGSFFQGVAAGQQAIEQQRTAEQQARRQALQQESTAEYQRAQQRLAEAKQLYDQDPTNPTNQLRLAQAQQALAMAGYYQQGGRGGGTASGPRPLSAAEYGRTISAINRDAIREYPDPPQGMPEPNAVREERLRRRAAYIESRIADFLESAARIQSGNLPAAPQTNPPQGPQGQRIPLPLTGTPRPAPTER